MEPKRELVHCLEKKELRNITCSKEKLKEFRGGGTEFNNRVMEIAGVRTTI